MHGAGISRLILEFVPANLRFGTFEMDLESRELRKGGTLIKLPPQPFQVLQLLAENGGALCSRDRIRQAVWGEDTHVDFDRNLNVCMAQIRAALSDEAESPRFIQTVPRRGYRFVAPVERPGEPAPASPAPAARSRRGRWIGMAAAIVLVAVVAVSMYQAPPTLVAALPFEDLSGAPAAGQFINGLLDETISAFGRAAPARLAVIARTSVKRFQGGRANAAEIGAELHAAYLVEGTLRFEGTRVRVTARLIQAASQRQIAEFTTEQDTADALAAQQRIAAEVAAAFVGKLFPGAKLLNAPPGHSPEASTSYLDAREAQRAHTRDGLTHSVAEFRNAVAREPGFSGAWAGLAESYVSIARSGEPHGNFEAAREAASRAIELDEHSPEAHNALANVLFWHDWNWTEAARHFRRAIELNPSFAAAHHDYAFFEVSQGHAREALAELNRALALDPLSPRVQIDSGWLLLQAHRFDEAVARARRSLELDPNLQEAFACLMRASVAKGDYAAALANWSRTERGPDPSANPEAAFREALRARVDSFRDPFLGASFHAFLGDRAAALDLLEKAHAAHSPSMVFLKTEPLLEPLHGEPRFEAIAKQLQLP